MENLIIHPTPSAPTVDDPKMVVFLGAYEAAKKKWIEEQRVLTSNLSATEEDKVLLGTQQSDELQAMLTFFNIGDDKNYIVPITWGTENAHPRLQGLTNIIVSQLNKNGILKPFLKGSDVEFGIWKEDTLGLIKGLAVDTEGYNLCNQLCMSFVNNFIPKESEIYSLMKEAIGKRVDESGRLMNHLLISDLFDEIWLEMRETQVHGKVQILAKPPKWRPGKDTVVAFNKRYDEYLCKRLGVQMAGKYLDTNPALRREYFMNYQTCMPPGYRKEVKFDILSNISWENFLKKYVKAESFLNTLEDTGVEENPHRCRTKDNNDNHTKRKTFPPNKNGNFNNRNGQKKRFKNNKTKYAQNKPNGYNNKNNKKPYVSNNGYNNNNQIVPYNGNNKIYNNVNQGNIRRYVPSNVANNNVKFNVPNKGRATKPGKRGPQVNALNIESLTDKICSKMQDMILTAKVSTLIALCLFMLFITPAGAQSNIPDIYPWEDCDKPRIPTFYRLTDTYLETTLSQAVTLTPIDEQCEIDITREPIIGFEIDSLIITWVGQAPKVPKEYTYKMAILTKCDPSAVVMVDNRYYTHTVDNSEDAKEEMNLNKDFIKDVRREFLLRCPDWDSPQTEEIPSDVSDTETASAGETAKAPVFSSFESVFDDFQLPDWDVGKQGQRTKNKAEEYLKQAHNVFDTMKKLAMSMEKNMKSLQIEKNALEDSCVAAAQAASRHAAAMSKQMENENEIKRLKHDIAQLKQEKSKMILQETHDSEVNQLKNELDLQRNGRLVAENNVKQATEINLSLGKRITSLESDLQTYKVDLEITKKEVKAKQEELNLLASAPCDGDETTISSNDLTNCLKLLSEANDERSTIARTLTSQHSKEKLLIENQLLDLADKNKRLNSIINRVKFNGAFIMKEIRNINHKPDGIACIVKRSLEYRLKSITSFMSGNTRLEYKQPDEVVYMKKNLKAVEKSQHYNSYADITKKLNTMVKDMDLNPTSQDYESILTFFGGVVTTILGRIVKDKLGDYIHNRRYNNNDNRGNNPPNTFSSLGIPIIGSPASRISSTPQRGILVNRHGRVGEQVNSILAPDPFNTPHHTWSPNIVVTVNSSDLQALIDTGATINVMSRKLCNELALPLESSSLKITTANGNIVSTIGHVTHSSTILGKDHILTYNVMEDCSHDLILGLPAIQQVGVKTLFSNETMIPSNSCSIIHVKVVPNIPTKKDVILDLHSYWKKADHILTFEQICSITDGIVPLVLFNAGRNPVKLHRNTHIGMVHTIEELNDDTLLVNSEEVIPDDADWEETLPPYPVGKVPLDKSSFIELIDLTNTLLTEEGKLDLLDILWEYKLAFHEYDGKPGLYSGNQRLNIKLKTDEVPRRIKPSRMSIEKEREVSKQIADMLRSGMIEPSRSPYLSRVVLVRKKDQQWRFVVDFRGINILIEQQTHIIPRIDKITEDAAGKQYYTSFDLKAGFHQIPLDENSRRIAAFITHEGVFQYKVMPMGLTGSPDKFQEVMDEVLHNVPNCYVYLDDILTCANDEKTHLNNIAEILNRIRHFGMKISIAKCQFAQPSAHYLGFVLDRNGIHPNPDKVKAINDKPTPRSHKEVKSFLGAASYFRRHIRNFSAIAEPLYKLDKNFLWKDIHEDAFKKLKDALINATTLSPPDNTKNYTIFTDASFQGLGAALVQQDKPIAFASRSLKPAEKNYPIIKLEALGLIYALKQFRPYIYGKHTLVITDHKPLLALLKNKELTGILQRYQMAIMEYDLTIQYIKGDANNVADYLSRDSFLAINVKEGLLEEVFPSNGHPPYHVDKFLQYYDEKESEIIPKTGKIRTPTGTRIYVPQQIREKLLETFHTHPLLGGHLSFDKMNGRFKSIFYWPKMDSDMMTSWRSCQICQMNKEQPGRLIETHNKSLPHPNEIWTVLNADFMQVDSDYILVLIDEYSKFVVTSVCKKQNGPTLKLILMKCFSMLGYPKILRSDNGPAFIAQPVTDYLASVNVEQQFSSPHNHTSNAIVERFNRTLRASIRIHKGEPLAAVTAHFTYAYNRSKNSSTGLSPAQILLNTSDRFTEETQIHNGYSGIHKLIKDTRDQFHEPDLKRHGLKLNEGDLVLRKVMHRKDAATSAKNQPTWEGPFKVIKHLYGDTYEIERIGNHRRTRLAIEKIHADRLKKYVP
uniref:RNA-directed DNA polymerase n=2 Tax=Strongyloides papillosus TaxID=174720 RepID=A0A0N5BZ40_STREA